MMLDNDYVCYCENWKVNKIEWRVSVGVMTWKSPFQTCMKLNCKKRPRNLVNITG